MDLNEYSLSEYLVFEVLSITATSIYSSLEIFTIKNRNTAYKPALIKNQFIPYESRNFSSTYKVHLAYNYLTRNDSKDRRLLSNDFINLTDNFNGTLNYIHDLFIPCQINFTEEEGFLRIKQLLDEMILALMDLYGFERKYIAN